MMSKTKIYPIVKRILDVIISAVALIVLLPVFVVIALVIRLDSKGSVFFLQKRAGRGDKTFRMVKFRTMRVDTPHDTATHLLKNADSYITRVGAFLRKTSLDELPQLWNIIVGDMSLVGPRPALWNQEDLLQARRRFSATDVRPGLTGWAQINGRDELPIEQKAQLDGEYVQRMSFCFDLRCILGTISAVIHRRGVVEGGTGAMQEKENR